MDTSSLPPGFARELEALRRRAYGLDADIDSDPVALHRLGELEDALHATVLTPEPDAEWTGDSSPRHPDQPVIPVVRERGHPRAGSALRGFVPIVAAVIAVAWVTTELYASHGDVVLAAAESSQQQRQDLVDGVDLVSLGMIGSHLQAFLPFHDLTVWSASAPSGETCLLVGSAEGGVLRVGCAPSPMQPYLDLRVGEHVPRRLVDDLPAGSVVRLVLRDENVGVWVAQAVDADR